MTTFLVDTMLGRLGRWLRLLGMDAEPRAEGDEAALVASLRGSGRTLLTRHRRRGARIAALGLPVLRICANDLGGQLREVRAAYPFPPRSRRFTRCCLCNALLSPEDRETAGPWVPPYVAGSQARFARCPRCRRVYWRSTHASRFERDLASFLGDEPPEDPARMSG